MHFKLFFHTLGVVENDPAHPGPHGQVWVFHTADEGTRKGDERARGAEELEKKSKIEEYNRKKRLEYE